MSDRNFEGQFRLYWMTGATEIASISAAALAASEDLTPSLPTGGIAIEGTENNSSLAMIDKGFVSESVGTEAATAAITLKRDDVEANDPARIFAKNETGVLVAAPFGGDGYTPATGDVVEAYLVEAHTPVPLPPAENTKQQVRVTFAVQDRNLVSTLVA